MSALIIEQSIMSEAKIISETPSKAIFQCPIQSVNEVNQNNRMYPSDVLKEGINAIFKSSASSMDLLWKYYS